MKENQNGHYPYRVGDSCVTEECYMCGELKPAQEVKTVEFTEDSKIRNVCISCLLDCEQIGIGYDILD